MSFHQRSLRRLVLRVLKESPKTGAEIIDAIDEMSPPRFRHELEFVYPLLFPLLIELEEEGYIALPV